MTSLACFTLLPDKTLFFSPSGRSLIAYVPRGRGAVALGDPIGPDGDRGDAIASFCAHCSRNDWHPAFHQSLPDHLDLYRSLGFRVLKIGEEGIVALDSFSLRGNAAAALRTPLNKFTRLGYGVAVHPPPVSRDLIEELRPISEEWLHRMHGSEKKFSLGWFDGDYLSGTTIALVRSPEGEIRAFANLITGFRADEVAIDLMRSRDALEPGAMDFLFVSLFLHFQAAGLRRFNLGLSALAGLREGSGSPRLERALARLGHHLQRFYGYRGLHDYENKFHPLWEPRYLVFPSLSALPEVIVALVRADSGDRLIDYLRPG